MASLPPLTLNDANPAAYVPGQPAYLQRLKDQNEQEDRDIIGRNAKRNSGTGQSTVNPNASPLKGKGGRMNAQMGMADYSNSNLQPRGRGPARMPQQPMGPEGGPERGYEDWMQGSFDTLAGVPGGMEYQKGNAKGMGPSEAFQYFMSDVYDEGSRGPERAAANLGFSRTDTEGRPIRPDYGYSRYGEAQDLDPNKKNPYRAFSTSGSGFKSNTQYAKKNPFQLRSEAERRERVDHYRFFDRQDANERQAQAASAVRARKQQQQADREMTQMDIASTGMATDRDGLTRYYNKEARERAGKAVGAARRAHDKGLSMEDRRAAAENFKKQSMMGEAEQNAGPGIREVQIAPEYGGGYGQSTRGFETEKPDFNKDYETRSGVPMSGREAFSTDKVPGFTGIYDTGRQGRGATGMAKALLDAGSTKVACA